MPVDATLRSEPSLGKYRLERRLGEGGMGVVWAATDTESGRAVALKTLKPHARNRPDLARRLMREARAASAVRHPNVVTIHEVFDAGDEGPVIVMELLDGETLRAKLAREEHFPVAEAAELLLPVVSAVATAHELGIVHRDLKPDNIFLCRNREGSARIQVLDFGIAKLVPYAEASSDSYGLTSTGTMLGTPCYMAPEQGFGESDIDARADVWALGVILYECLSGGRPLEGDNLGQVLKRLTSQGITPLAGVAPDVPDELARLVGRMLVTERERRLSDLREVERILMRYAANPAGAPTTAPRRRGTSRAPALAAVGVLAIGFGFFASHAGSRHAETHRPPALRPAPEVPAPSVVTDDFPTRASPVSAKVPELSPPTLKPLPPMAPRKHPPVGAPSSVATATVHSAQHEGPAPPAAADSTILGGLVARPPF